MDQYPFDFTISLWISHYAKLRSAILLLDDELGIEWKSMVDDMDRQLKDQLTDDKPK